MINEDLRRHSTPRAGARLPTRVGDFSPGSGGRGGKASPFFRRARGSAEERVTDIRVKGPSR